MLYSCVNLRNEEKCWRYQSNGRGGEFLSSLRWELSSILRWIAVGLNTMNFRLNDQASTNCWVTMIVGECAVNECMHGRRGSEGVHDRGELSYRPREGKGFSPRRPKKKAGGSPSPINPFQTPLFIRGRQNMGGFRATRKKLPIDSQRSVGLIPSPAPTPLRGGEALVYDSGGMWQCDVSGRGGGVLPKSSG